MVALRWPDRRRGRGLDDSKVSVAHCNTVFQVFHQLPDGDLDEAQDWVRLRRRGHEGVRVRIAVPFVRPVDGLKACGEVPNVIALSTWNAVAELFATALARHVEGVAG